MKLGVHSATFVKEWSEDIKPYIKKCHEAGYKSVEVSLLGQNFIKAKEIGKLAKDLNIEITCTTGLSNEEDIASEDLEIRLKGIDKLKEAIDVTSTPSTCLNAGKYASLAKLAPTMPTFIVILFYLL